MPLIMSPSDHYLAMQRLLDASCPHHDSCADGGAPFCAHRREQLAEALVHATAASLSPQVYLNAVTDAERLHTEMAAGA